LHQKHQNIRLSLFLLNKSQSARAFVKAVATREEAERLIALGYEFHYRAEDGVDLFRKKVMGLD
jgi:hypothetical protein